MLLSTTGTISLLLLWLLLAEGNLASLLVGIPFIALAWWVYRIQRASNLISLSFSLSGAFRFLVFFLWESLRGGLDVAARVWRPRIPLSPAFVEYQVIFPDGPIRVVFLYTISLLPGTLSVKMDEHNCLKIHTLDASGDMQGELAKLEARVCDLFALPASYPHTK